MKSSAAPSDKFGGMAEEERIALFVDFENIAIGARDRGETLDMAIIMDALSERGRVVVRRAYADWNLFAEYRENLIAQRIELLEIPQRSGVVRKNSADIKLAVDALELAFQREFITTFVVASGDSDFTPLVLKLRELDKKVVGVGVEGSTSGLLPGACDEFLFYERLLGGSRTTRRHGAESPRSGREGGVSGMKDLERLIPRTLWGLQRSHDGPVLSSMIKRAILRKDPTFSEADYGFRTWSELMRHMESNGIVELKEGSADGDPGVEVPQRSDEARSFELLRDVLADLQRRDGTPALSGLKDHMRKRDGSFTEKDLGYGGFLQFVRAAQARGLVEMEWDDEAEDYFITAAGS